MSNVAGVNTGNTSGATNVSIEGLASSTQGQNLLTALVGFIEPIIQAYAPGMDSSVKHDNDLAQPGAQDIKLLDALRSFVKLTISTQETLSRHQKEHDDAHLEITERPANTPIALPLNILNKSELDKLMDSVRSRVFSKMPIRMLAFDSSGSGMRLLDRNATVNHILHSAFAEANSQQFIDKLRYGPGLSQSNQIADLVQKHSMYAILSHTWIRDTPGDVVITTWNNRTDNPQGYAKIVNFCQVAARKHGVTLGWMDTVCINKESSSELDESIRSMYKWYQGANVCVAYMSETETLESMHKDSWFRRGWTLQELLAPENIRFYNRDWKAIQNKVAYYSRPWNYRTNLSNIQGQIQRATTITPTEIAHCRRGMAALIPISRKFELASKRIVTREEDQVYSLMGLLDVDISVAYGEGAQRALFRLQREIIATKKCPLDIFNCIPGYKNKLLPSQLRQYDVRTKEFDRHDNNTATTLDLWIPAEPLVCTHLGVRLQVILIPGIVQHSSLLDPNGHWSAKGYFHGSCHNSFLFLLMHKCIYKKVLTGGTGSNNRQIIHFGVINFTVKNEFITFPDTCLAVPLNCGTTPAGSVTQSDVKIFKTRGPVTFKIESTDGTRQTYIHDLERNGMQLLTLHL